MNESCPEFMGYAEFRNARPNTGAAVCLLALGMIWFLGDQEAKEIIRQDLLENEGAEFGLPITSSLGDLPLIPNRSDMASLKS